MTVERRTLTGVFLPLTWNSLARVYVAAGSSPVVPYASNSPNRPLLLVVVHGVTLPGGEDRLAGLWVHHPTQAPSLE